MNAADKQRRLRPNTVPKDVFVQAVSRMAEEVWDFHNRWGFGSGGFAAQTPADIIRRRREILAEEIRELDEAATQNEADQVLNEAADVLFVAMGHVEAMGEAGVKGVDCVTRKNSLKTEATHAIRSDTGKLLPIHGKPHKWR